jgi:dipeptidyl aminopeptidase/acylaminoacyl peptidase
VLETSFTTSTFSVAEENETVAAETNATENFRAGIQPKIEQTSALYPAWSPDGSLLAFSAAPAAPSSVDGGPEAKAYLDRRRIWVADASGRTDPKQITQDDRYRDEEPSWSADGTHILFGRIAQDGTQALWLMGASGENPIQISGPLELGGDWDFKVSAGSEDVALPRQADIKSAWFGYYGHISWRKRFDWFRASL